MAIYPQGGNSPLNHYQLYIAGHGLYARDSGGKAVQIGAIESEGGELAYQLSIAALGAPGFLTAEKLLQDVAAKLAYASLHQYFATAPAVPPEQSEPATLCLDLENEEPGERMLVPLGAAE